MPPHVLYIVYWGAMEPLGQALVVPAVRRLAASGVRLTLVTFEKPSDLARGSAVGELRGTLDRAGVSWVPLRYHQLPQIPAKILDVTNGVARGLAVSLGHKVDIVHARTFVGGLMGLVLAPLLGARLVFHNEGFYPDEQVDAGVWPAGSVHHRLARFLEQQMYARADAVMVLSRRSRETVAAMPSVLRHPKPVVVVPSAIDLSRFPVPTRRPRQPGMLRLVYSGSVGGRYHMEGTGRFAVAARGQAGSVHLRILTRAARATVAEQLAASGLKPDEWSCEALAPADVPAELARHHAGIHLPRPGIASHGGSPTKIGEYWASGLPVVVSRGIGDIDEITGRMEVGIVVADLAEDALRAAARGLDHLLGDNDLRGRCRRAAEEHYSLERAVADQRALYDRFAPKMNDDARQ